MNALKYLNESLELYEALSNEQGIAKVLNHLGDVYLETDDPDIALKKYRKALEIEHEIGDKKGIVASEYSIGRIYYKKRQYIRSLEYLKKAFEMADEMDLNQERINISESLIKTYAGLGMHEKAVEYFEFFKRERDSLFSEQSQKIITEMQTKYETEKKEQKIELLNNQMKLKDKINRQQRYIIYFIIGVIAVIFGFLFLVYRQNKQIKKANILLEEQNDLISQQKQEITDSIHYASRIQNAILPPETYLQKNIKEHFILFKPRDIVSGDYYWMTQKNNQTIITAADCTGHGVPGAFMSMLGVAMLNEIVNNMQTLNAACILNELRTNIIKSLHQTGEFGGSKDGMDMTLCIINWKDSSIQFAGANNPLYMIRNNELSEIKGDKMPIGIYAKGEKPFTNHQVNMQKNDVIYMFSDGYADQFGGPAGKKFKYKTFKELLVKIHEKPMEEQKIILDETIINWQGDYKQLDDIIVMGIRF